MESVAIRVEGLGKQYRLGERQPYRALRDVVSHAASAPLRRIRARREGQVRQGSARDDYIWALRDVSFEVQRGDVLGIVGGNGAGKSTILKILSRITEPTTGVAEIHGRVGSLLEVGTGFHPELTGRENIFLNGAILGMQRAEIARKFDEIVAFAEVERFIDTPVKHYSSGMYMRLAFAVAAHLEPDILIVDEVLAVGDIAFQRKCLGKMGDVARQGRTVLFVSHNLDAVRRLCSHCLLLERGRLVGQGDTPHIVEQYLSTTERKVQAGNWIDTRNVAREGSGEVRFTAVHYSSLNPHTGLQPYPEGPLECTLALESDADRSIASLAITISTLSGIKLINADTFLHNRMLAFAKGNNTIRLRIDRLHLQPGQYRLGLWVADPISAHTRNIAYDYIESAGEIEVVEANPAQPGINPNCLVTADFELVLDS